MGSMLRQEPEQYYKEYREDVSVAEYEDEWEVERRRYSGSLRAMKERDKELVRIANEKLRRAREKGKGRASLSQDEIEALERRRMQDKNADRRASTGKTSRNASSMDLQVDKTRRKTGRVASSPVPSSPRATSKSTRSPKGSRTASLDRQEALPYPDTMPYNYAPATQSDPLLYHRSASDAYPPRDSSLYTPRHFSQETQRVSSAPRYPPAENLSPTRVRAATLSQPSLHPSSGRRFVSGPEFSSRLRHVSPAPGPSPVREVPAYFDSDASGESVVVVPRRASDSEGDSTPRRKEKERRRKKR